MGLVNTVVPLEELEQVGGVNEVDARWAVILQLLTVLLQSILLVRPVPHCAVIVLEIVSCQAEHLLFLV